MFGLGRKKKKQVTKRPPLNRETALKSRPLAATPQKRQELPDGRLRFTVMVTPGRISKFLLRLPEKVEHEIELDPLGAYVFELCDGQRNVQFIIKKFAQDHELDRYEAEKSVTRFLQTLMRRGLVTMVVPK